MPSASTSQAAKSVDTRFLSWTKYTALRTTLSYILDFPILQSASSLPRMAAAHHLLFRLT